MDTILPTSHSHLGSESWNQFHARTSANRKKAIADAAPDFRAALEAADAACAAVDTAARVIEQHRRDSHCLTNRRLSFPSSPQTVQLLEDISWQTKFRDIARDGAAS
jgi:hypothetical protein